MKEQKTQDSMKFNLEKNIELINKNANDLYEKYAKKHFDDLSLSTDESIAFVAAKLGYRPSVQKTAFFLSSSLSIGSYFDDVNRYPQKNGVSNDTTKTDILCEAVILQLFVPFLRKSVFNKESCISLMDKIFEIYYFRENATDFSYGVAQKWVNMAIKYFIIINFKKSSESNIVSYINEKYDDYTLFPIDGIMIQKIHKHFGDMTYDSTIIGCHLPTPQPWSNCNLKFTFIDYWQFILDKLCGIKPIFYEMAIWTSED